MDYLVAALWLLGILAIVGIALLLTRRPPRPTFLRRTSDRLPAARAPAGALREAGELVVIAVSGTVVVFAIKLALGAAWVVHHGSAIDHPIYTFTVDHQKHIWLRLMARL